ncbi:MAG: argininosuccinate lyase, partial [Rikenellaceae bacterium]|nr:argininosuccinate lyase [Rikenellaceae bacterium]
MMAKLWSKGTESDPAVERFTVGRDREMDARLARADVLGSLAHTRMLNSIGLLTDQDLDAVQKELKAIYRQAAGGQFSIAEGVEDVHSQVEFMLTERLGEAGKKIHSGRSRNDQVLVDLRIYLRGEIRAL